MSNLERKKIIETLGPVEALLTQPLAQISKSHSKYLNPIALNMINILGTKRRFLEAQGIHVRDDQGFEYLDFISGLGSNNLGHEPEEVLAALKLIEKRPNMLQSALSPFAAKLAEYLAALTPGKLQRSFFCNSGAEAVESALKLARKATERRVLLGTQGGYHGKTFGALSVSGKPEVKQPFEPLLAETEVIPFNDLERLKERLMRNDVAAFIVEPIQGENGVIVPEQGYLKEVERLCRKYGTLLLLDEIQTGMGRTGKLFCCEFEEVEPDVLILSKSLGGGVMPIGVMITTDALWKKAYGTFNSALLHTSTFGGNARACVCGIAALRTLIEKNLAENAAEMGTLLLDGLRKLKDRFSVLHDVRGQGLMIGLALAQFKGRSSVTEGALTIWVSRQLLKRHRIITLFTFSNLNVLRIAPPLTVTKEEVETFLTAVEDVLASAEKFGHWRLLRKAESVSFK